MMACSKQIATSSEAFAYGKEDILTIDILMIYFCNNVMSWGLLRW